MGVRANTKRGSYNTSGKQSWKRLGITKDDGWTSSMRTKYFRMQENSMKSIIKNDMTNINNRPEGKTKSNSKSHGKQQVDGIWSDSKFDATAATSSQFLRFVIFDDKRKKDAGEKFKSVKNLKDINKKHVVAFLLHKLEAGLSPDSVDRYRQDLQKWGECNVKFGIKSHTRLVPDEIRELIPDFKKEDRTRSLGETDGIYGYTLEQARTLIEHAEQPQVKAALETLTYTGLRNETFFELEWNDVLNENEEVDDYFNLDRDGLMKNNRKQIAEVNDAAPAFVSLWSSGEFTSNHKVFGDDFTSYTLQREIEKICDETGIDWKGYHAFRSATFEYYDTELVPDMTKEELVDGIERFVNHEVYNPKTGEMERPLNPLVPKKEFAGYGVKSDGTRYPKFNVVTGDDGHPIMVPKYEREWLETKRIDWLRNTYIAEQLSHNRSDANGPYRRK